MPKIEVSITIKRLPEAVYKVVRDMESFPQYIRDIKSLKIIKRAGDKVITAWETEIDGAPVSWKEEDLFYDENHEIKFNMVDGNYKQYYGSWSMERNDNDTKLTLKANFDWGIPVLEKYVTKALEAKARRGLLGMLKAIKSKTEKTDV
jgi:ribosome-associated toxin RatA of RatAB toxin-antitoxin module